MKQTQVAYEIYTNYKGYKIATYGLATFEFDHMRSTETTSIDSNDRSWVDEKREYQLSYWQKAVSLDEFIKVMDAKGFCPRVIT